MLEEMLELPKCSEKDLNTYYMRKFSSFAEQKDDEIEEILIALQRQPIKRKAEPELTARATYGLHPAKEEKKEESVSTLSQLFFKAYMPFYENFS